MSTKIKNLKKRRLKQLTRQGGFTLLEIIMVVVIIGVLISFLIGGVTKQAGSAKAKINKTKMIKLKSWISLYRTEYNQLPKTLKSLYECDDVTGPACSPSATDQDVLDAWGNQFRYSVSGGTYTIKSLGSDGTAGGKEGAADVTIKGP